MKPVFVDANILLEILLPNRQKTELAANYLAQNPLYVVSPLSAHLYVYFGRKFDIPLGQLLGDLEAHRYTSFNDSAMQWAIHNCQGNDFEDALQVACALQHGCASMVTLDIAIAKRYSNIIDVQVL